MFLMLEILFGLCLRLCFGEFDIFDSISVLAFLSNKFFLLLLLFYLIIYYISCRNGGQKN